MIKKLICSFLFILLLSSQAFAFWMWTPETGKWVNPKYAVKETPKKQLDYAKEIYASNDVEKAVKELRKLIKHYPKAREAADAQYFIGRFLQDEGQFMEAFNEYQLVLKMYPFSERAGEVVDRQYEIGNMLLDGTIKPRKFLKTIPVGDYDVIEIFRGIIKNAPYGKHAAPSQYKIGLYLQGKGLYQEARDEFEKTINDYPESEWAKAAKYQTALADAKRSAGASYEQKITESAIQEFESFVKEYPDAELSQQAVNQIDSLKNKEAENHFLVAEFYEKQKQYRAAKIYYNKIVSEYKRTTWAPKALEKLRELK